MGYFHGFRHLPTCFCGYACKYAKVEKRSGNRALVGLPVINASSGKNNMVLA